MRLIKALLIIPILLCLGGAANAVHDPNVVAGRISARTAGIADASGALPGTSESVFSNPAALVQVVWPEIVAGFGNKDLGDQRLGYMCGSIPVIEGLVAGIGYTSVFFPMDTYSDNRTLQFALAFPLSRNEKLMIGLAGKYVRRYIPELQGSADGGGIDLGLLYQAFSDDQTGHSLQFGMSLLDAQTTVTLNQEDLILPIVFRLGAYYALDSSISFSFTYDNQNSANEYFAAAQTIRAGVERLWDVEETIGLAGRMGYLQQLQKDGLLTAGVGMTVSDFRFDYAFQLPVTMSDATHLVSISWGFEKQKNKADHLMQRKKAIGSEPEIKKEKKDDFFSALESAAELGDAFTVVEEQPLDVEKAESRLSQNDIEEEDDAEEETYHIPVPIGPAGQESAALGVAPEMPAAFSGRFGRRRSDEFSIQKQDLRLHVVVNPFSPNNDGRQDKTIFVGRLVTDQLRVASWILTLSQNGTVVRYFKGGSRLPRNLEWDGKDKRGRKLSDGKYMAVLRVMDQHNMQLAIASQSVEIRTKPISFSFASPGDRMLSGARKEPPMVFKFPKIPGSSNWRFRVSNPSGKQIFRKSGSGQLPNSLTWNLTQRGAIAAGTYRARISFIDDVGMRSSVSTTFKIRHAKFSISMTAKPELFKPKAKKGDGVQFGIELEGKMKIKNWELAILEKNKKKTLQTFRGQGKPQSGIVWDGTLADGALAQGGRVYYGRLTLVSALGTRSVVKSRDLQCDVGVYSGKKALSINLVRIYFLKGSFKMEGKAKQALSKAAGTLRKYPTEYSLRVVGHCNQAEVGGEEMTLSRQRAEAVTTFLITETGIPAEKIKALGKGSSDLIVKGDSKDSGSKNQRVEVILFAK